jgi:sec-independent protein translocase protein TatC
VAALRRGPALLLAALVLLPLASAAPAGGAARVELLASGGVYNGLSARDVAGAGVAEVWIPAGARPHAVEAVTPAGNVSAAWRADGLEALSIDAPPDATAVQASFDVRAGLLTSLVYVAPDAPARVDVAVAPPDGQAVQGFAQGADGLWRASLEAPRAGDTLVIRVVDADRVGELPILLTVGIVAALVLAGTLLWHRVRPINEGRPAQTFLEHLGELQQRLLPPVIVFAVLNFVYFASGLRLATWRGLTLVAPTFSVESSLASRAFEAFAERLVPAGVQLVVLRPADAVLAQVQMTLFLAFVTVLPLLLYELAVFVGPALQARERRMALRSIPLVCALFVAGSIFGYLVMAPLMIRTLYDFAPATGAAPLLVVGDLISFSLIVIVSFGLAFELPVLMYVTARLGLVRAATYRKYLRHAIVVIVLVAGIVTPDPSVVSQLLVAVPVTALYVVGLLAATLAERRRARRAGASAAGA